MKIKLIVLDLDGTVLNRGQDMTRRTADVLGRAGELGCVIAVSTGRSDSIVPDSIKASPFVSYLITSNGACIRSVKDGSILYQKFMDRQTVEDVFKAAQGRKTYFGVFFENRASFEIPYLSYMFFILKIIRLRKKSQWTGMRSRIRRVRSARREAECNPAPIEKMVCMFRHSSDGDAVYNTLSRNDAINVVRVQGGELEITEQGVSKGTSLQLLCRILGIHKDEVAAFGDSGNDLPMKEAAGVFVAMGNAEPEVKQQADYVTGTVGEDGVAQWLEQNLEV